MAKTRVTFQKAPLGRLTAAGGLGQAGTLPGSQLPDTPEGARGWWHGRRDAHPAWPNDCTASPFAQEKRAPHEEQRDQRNHQWSEPEVKVRVLLLVTH